MSDRAFIAQLEGYGLTTAEIHYYRLDAPSLLQLFVWQEHDLAPDFPVLFDFLGYWDREIGAALHSVRIAHDRLIRPTEWRAVDGVISIQGVDAVKPKNFSLKILKPIFPLPSSSSPDAAFGSGGT
jgi:uncharacterized protein Usg